MRDLIAQIRASLPFDGDGIAVCTGDCQECPQKLLACLEDELLDWERRLDAGETPGLADLSRLAGLGREVRSALARRGLLDASDGES